MSLWEGFVLAVVVLPFSAGWCPAQRLVVGEKAPELKVGEWLLHKDALSDSRPTLVEFFFSRSEPSLRRLTVLDGFMTRSFRTAECDSDGPREPAERLAAALEGERLRLYCGARRREPDVLAAYGVQFVPFAVLFDARGRVVWFGNSSKFGDAELQRELGWN